MVYNREINSISFLKSLIVKLYKKLGILSVEEKDMLETIIKDIERYENNDFEFKEIVDHLYDGIYISDGTGRTLYVNKAYSRITGIKPQEVIGRTVQEIEDEGKLFRNAVTMKVITHKMQVNSVGTSLKNGKKMLITGNPIFDEQGNVKKVVINNREMTDLLEMKAELDASQKKLKTVEKLERKNRQEIQHLRKLNLNKGDIIGESEAVKNVRKMIQQVADVDVTVLITGETGVGKEVVANEIFKNSKRKDESFIKINCAAIPNNLLEAELFGYEKGAFTGAVNTGKIGMLELANKGTILLDEIGEIPMELQSKLLRAIQHKEIKKIGGTKHIELDVRILAATNRNLKELVEKGSFREDLFYRLNVVPIQVPPLRSRLDDIELLAKHFLLMYNKKHGRDVELDEMCVDILKKYTWPGNIRELQNIIERLVVITEKGYNINRNQLSNMLNIDLYNVSDLQNKEIGLKQIVENVERDTIKKALAQFKTTREVAKVLKVDQSTIVKKAKRLGIKIER